MKITRRRDYNNSGVYPANEYTTPNKRTDENPAVDLDETSRTRGVESGRPVLPRLHYPLSPRKRRWLRTQSTSGWRAKAAAKQHSDYHT